MRVVPEMPFHDPKREVEKLRDHVASHDKPLAFLIGAGASCAVRDPNGGPLIPGIVDLGARCADAVTALGDEHRASYDSILVDLHARFGRAPNIEDTLSDVRGKLAVMGPADELAGANSAQLEQIEETIRTTIAATARPDEAIIPPKLPHHELARWIARIDRKVPVELFTTNYDTLLERALDAERVPTFDGFVGSRQPFFSPASLVHPEAAPGRRWTRLWKIHGSINWQRAPSADGTPRIIREAEHGGGELIFPSFHKYDESRKQPYVAMLEHLGRVLNRPDETVMVTVGYSFGDQHINEVLFDALDARERTHVVSLQFGELSDDHELIKRAGRRHNLLVYGPATAVIGGERGQWRLLEPVDARIADLLDAPFDSDAVPDPNAVNLTGTFRLGNFVWFARFLAQIASGNA